MSTNHVSEESPKRYPQDEFEYPRLRIDAYPTLQSYLASRSDDELAALIWNPIYQRNIFGSYAGGSGDHSLAIIAESRRRAADSRANQAVVTEEEDERRREGWSSFEDDYLTDGKGYAPKATYDACRAAYNTAWTGNNQTEAVRAAAAKFRELHPLSPAAPSRAEGQEPVEVRALAELFAAAEAEARKAMSKFPQPNYVITKVAEEAGEVVKAAVHCAEGRESPENVIAEIKQAMAMLIRLYLEGDQVHGLPPLAAAEIRSALVKAPAPAVPDGWKLVPARMKLTATAIRNLLVVCGGPEADTYMDGVLWVGECRIDEDGKLYGLNVENGEYPEEGSATLVEFPALPGL